ncbi:helix-turn-helix domain-containing protein [Streptomyces roseirectus]|uniref:helix-turn-helix domain-containing protein n=1 Tax=Streptomyces roseirectus TaxID=2768066 RepID=UPI001FE97E19|nr:helix-turn-helix domain-containing protein [Streptomyces roseirectus]
MDTPEISVPSHAQSRPGARKHPNRRHPHAGLVHENTRHTNRFTVIGNHLAQHPDMSLLAIGLAVHIQSLPSGTPIAIKSLAARFPEGAVRIAAGLRELEAHGYLRREREHIQGGRIITRTVSCNQPGRVSRRASGHGNGDADHDHDHSHDHSHGHGIPDHPTSPSSSPCPGPRPAQQPRKKALPVVPQPSCTAPALFQQASDVLARLRRHDPRLFLSAADVAHLAPGVAAWLERDVSPTAVRRALTENLPVEPLHRPAAFLAHRLTALLPPVPYPGTGRPVVPVDPGDLTPVPVGPVGPVVPVVPPDPRVPAPVCPGCERPYRRPTTPGTPCLDCRPHPSPPGTGRAAQHDWGPGTDVHAHIRES